MTRSRGAPCLISVVPQVHSLERLILGAGNFDENWLQNLLHDRPDILPIGQIEPGFGDPVPVARELTCGHGRVDNLYLTPSGEIILVEAKLWSNPQARREVVAQALDYIVALMRMDYEGFETAVGNATGVKQSLYGYVSGQSDALPEAEFVDAVSNNLKRGRILVMVVGDGIRREAEALASLLQSHAGAHFTFALVELAMWRNLATGDILVIPDTLAQTVMIERGVVRLESGVLQVEAALAQIADKPKSISEEIFYEELAKLDPALPSSIQAFLRVVEPMGVYSDLKASLNLKIDLPDLNRPVNLGYFHRQGKLWTIQVASSVVPQEMAIRYNQTLASLIGGAVAIGSTGSYVTDGKSVPPISALLPTHANAWAAAIQTLIDEIKALPTFAVE